MQYARPVDSMGNPYLPSALHCSRYAKYSGDSSVVVEALRLGKLIHNSPPNAAGELL